MHEQVSEYVYGRVPYLWYDVHGDATKTVEYLTDELIIALLRSLVEEVPYVPEHVTYLEVYVTLTGVLLKVLNDVEELLHLEAIEATQELVDYAFGGCHSTLHVDVSLL